MKIDSLFEGLKRIKNGDYVLEGDLRCDESLEIELDDRLVVRGAVTVHGSIQASCSLIAGEGIKAGWGIEAGEGIKAGWGIEAGEGIKAGCDIEAGEGIKAGGDIEAGEGIKAGTYIHAEKRIFAGIAIYHSSEECAKTIQCAELRKGEICYGELVIKPRAEAK